MHIFGPISQYLPYYGCRSHGTTAETIGAMVTQVFRSLPDLFFPFPLPTSLLVLFIVCCRILQRKKIHTGRSIRRQAERCVRIAFILFQMTWSPSGWLKIVRSQRVTPETHPWKLTRPASTEKTCIKTLVAHT